MDLTLNLVSSICWEVIAKHNVRLNVETLPVLKLLLEAVYDFSPEILEQNLRIYWRYSREDYLEITDYFSFCAFLNLMVEPSLYLVIGDAHKFYADTEKFLKILDLMELKRVKELEWNKYDLKCEAEEIEKEIQECQASLKVGSSLNASSEVKDDKDILRFALRNMPMGRCYTSDICSGYSLIDCVRKGWPKSKKILTRLPDEIIDKRSKKDKDKDKGKVDNKAAAKPDKKGKNKK